MLVNRVNQNEKLTKHETSVISNYDSRGDITTFKC